MVLAGLCVFCVENEEGVCLSRNLRSTAILQGEATEHGCRRRTDSGAAMQDREPSWKCAVEQRWIRFGSSAERLFTGLLYVVSEERKGLQSIARILSLD
ncbi:hypothetical protein CDAR_10381 [Caerostris darwini]|uniref:Uncharacterized protein n=1 Tax=Caerostris darwini TaxID=1538125 RepID=A0AAV4RV35_9ARAC|nr:hypothetical protein CDAR_10381 [Caerostris darwini]